MGEPLRRIAVVNRGEPAMRFLNAAKALRWERRLDLRTIALCTDVDRRSWFVRHADEVVTLGPAMRPDPRTGRLRHAYLDLDLLRDVLRQARVDAVWAGWGFVAEDPSFVELCDELGIRFVGPPAAAMRRLGDKVEAKRIAERAGVPVAPWSGGPIDERTAEHRAEELGYPLLVKAAAGGGGRGIRLVHSPGELSSAVAAARAEAEAAFGDGTVFLEALLPGARHVEVQVAVDDDGTAWALGVRDCSVQRRRQKVIEESASTALDAATQSAIADAAVRLCQEAQYRNVGTVEFLAGPDRSEYAFMEVNARLQVEHTVTEAVTGVDLVRLQLDLAAGHRLTGSPPVPFGHAVEVRLNAEDPDRGFAPAPGRVATMRIPQGPGIRVDAGVVEGDDIPAEFDSMIAKVIAWGRDRDEATARLRAALEHSLVVVEGGATNRSLLIALLDHPRFRDGDVDVRWLDEAIDRGELLPGTDAALALVAATLEAYEARAATELRHFVSTARRGRPDVRRADDAIEVTMGGRTYALFVYRLDERTYRIRLGTEVLEVEVERFGPHELRLRAGDRSRSLVARRQDSDHVIEVGSETHRVHGGDAGVVRAPAPAVVVDVAVVAGQDVRAGAPLAVLEAMKMETVVTAPADGRVREVVHANTQVDAGDVLVRLDVASDSTAQRADQGAPLALAAAFGADPLGSHGDLVGGRPPAPARRVGALRRVLDVLHGYDLEPTEPDLLLADLDVDGGGGDRDPRSDDGRPASTPADVGDAELSLGDDVLEVFAEVCTLASRRPRGDIPLGAVERGEHEHLLAYLRAPQRALPTLPTEFVERVRRLVAPHGVRDLDRDDVDRALYHVYAAVHGVDRLVPHVIAILDGRLALAERLRPSGRGIRSVEALDRLIAATEGSQPAVAEHARAVRYRYVEQPLLRAVREAAVAEVDELVATVATGGSDAQVRRLVDSPHELQDELLRRLWSADARTRTALLGVLARRACADREVGSTEVVDGEWPLVITNLDDGESPRVLVTACRPLDDLPALLAAAQAAVVDRRFVPGTGGDPADGPDVVLDLVLLAPGPVPATAAFVGALSGELLAALTLEDPTRVDLTVHTATRDAPPRHASFVWQHGEVEEVAAYRDLHPALARRLELWRLREFELERLPSAEGMYLFRATARDNPLDERLFAIAEVHDLTAVRDDGGTPAAWPDLERTMVEALASIRTARLQRPLTERPIGNRITLYVRPEWTLDADDLRRLAHRFAPASDGLGLEKVVVRIEERDPVTGVTSPRVLHMTKPTSTGVSIGVTAPSANPIRPLTPTRQATARVRRRGEIPPADIVVLLTSPSAMHADFPVGHFVELDLDGDGALVEVDRPIGENVAGVVIGRISNATPRYPEGMERVLIMGDPARRLGALAEPECRRIIAALDLAEQLSVPVEWFAVSAGARVALDSGTENMDWTAAVLRRIIELSQRGGTINVVVSGVNVGAQSYFDAEATMLLHTRGILVMVGDASMVLTGKQALDVSGGVSAHDNAGIGGFERVMGPNGEAHLWAPTIEEACALLFAHYEHTYVAPGERFPRPSPTADPGDRDVRGDPHPCVDGASFTTVGEIFSTDANPERKRPFDIRAVMRAVIDRDHQPLETWSRWRGAEHAVVWDAHLGGQPVRLLGIESHHLERHGPIPADGPEQWSGGTLFPLSSKKVARAINAASGNRPVVVLANLSGFDGSPESLRELQLEYGAEIGRAVVNFDGPIVFCVVSRYHGGAFVVFSKALNPELEVAAIEGSRASVLGGAAAAAVVFARDVDDRVRADGRVAELSARIEVAPEAERDRLRAELDRVVDVVRSEALGEMGARFDAIHTIERARAVGSVDTVITAAGLRPYLVDAVDRGVRRTAARAGARADEPA